MSAKLAGNTIVFAAAPLRVYIMSLLEVGPVIFGGVAGIVTYLRQHRLLPTQKSCSRCSVSMRERPREDISDKSSWWCPQCKTRKSIRDGSFFAKSRLTLQKWLLILYLWAREYPVTDVAEEAEVDASTAVDIFQWLREVSTTSLLQTQIILGGENKIVQIDESLFRHKPKVNIFYN